LGLPEGANKPRGFDPPLWGGGESQWGYFRLKSGVHFRDLHYCQFVRL